MHYVLHFTRLQCLDILNIKETVAKNVCPSPMPPIGPSVNPLLCHNANFGHICPKFSNYHNSIDI